MKKLLLITFLFIAFNSFAQERYAMVTAQQKPLSQKFYFTADFGQPTSTFTDTRIKTAEGEIVKFNSTVDVLNYMSSQGWTVVNSNIYVTQNVTFQNFLFKRND